ncbi:MAG: polyprenyl synthetase family protein [Kofleriaceae bacterium]
MSPEIARARDARSAPLADALDDAIADGTIELDPEVPVAVWERALVGPASLFLARPGKDLRARLVSAGFTLAGGHGVVPAAVPRALELLHAGSLIVDDVEDRSDERRGAPALHHLVGEPLAINTGSWMYFWALAELAKLGLPGAVELAITALVGCHQGQALDLATRIVDLDVREVPGVVAATTRLKTGALCRLAVELGALAAGASPDRRCAIGDLGEAAGCALQMLDDLGCIVSAERRHKAYEDLRAARPTWTWAWLASTCDPFAWARFVALARATLAGADPAILADAFGERVETIGRAHVRDTLVRAVDAVRGIAPAEVIEQIAAELCRMENMYG